MEDFSYWNEMHASHESMYLGVHRRLSQIFPLLIPLSISYIFFSTIRIMTSEMTKSGRKTKVANTVSAKLLVRRNAINGLTANAKLTTSNKNLKKSLQLRGIRSQVNFLSPHYPKNITFELMFSYFPLIYKTIIVWINTLELFSSVNFDC